MTKTWHDQLRNKNREELLEVGKKLFLAKGFVNVSIKMYVLWLESAA